MGGKGGGEWKGVEGVEFENSEKGKLYMHFIFGPKNRLPQFFFYRFLYHG